jgi:hypothetical protein
MSFQSQDNNSSSVEGVRPEASFDRTSSSSSGVGAAGGDEYPPQLHAGKVGYGPEFGKGVVSLSCDVVVPFLRVFR